MQLGTPQLNPRLSWLAIGLTPFALALAAPSQAQVVWEPVSEEQTERKQVLVPLPGNSRKKPLKPQPIVWEPVPATERNTTDASNAIVWTPVPESESVAEGSAPSTTVVWELIPDSDSPLEPAPTSNLAEASEDSSGYEQEAPPPEVIAQEAAMPPRMMPELPPPPPLQALNRSIAFGDGSVGPDIGMRVPNGLRWSERWFGDAAIVGHSKREKNQDFFAWNNGDAVAIVHANLVQSNQWSFGINSSFRSIYEGDNAAGGSTKVGEGFSSGFRLARQIGDTGGIAFGGEQIVQWDDKTDTGRNFYLMATKGWWLGAKGKNYPLLIANGGFGTGRFAFNDELAFACIKGVEKRTGTFDVDNDLCWGPIGSLSLVVNEWLGAFVEYNSNEPGAALAAVSINATGGIPLRLTWGVVFGEKNRLFPNTEKYSWMFRASLGF